MPQPPPRSNPSSRRRRHCRLSSGPPPHRRSAAVCHRPTSPEAPRGGEDLRPPFRFPSPASPRPPGSAALSSPPLVAGRLLPSPRAPRNPPVGFLVARTVSPTKPEAKPRPEARDRVIPAKFGRAPPPVRPPASSRRRPSPPPRPHRRIKIRRRASDLTRVKPTGVPVNPRPFCSLAL
jgi:hypothetical protein